MNEKNDIVLELKNINLYIKNEIKLKNINIKAYKGKINLLLGRNGQGKTLLLNIAAMQHDNFEGEIFYKKEDIKKIDNWKNILFLPTDFGFPDFLNAYDFVKTYLKLFSTKITSRYEIEIAFKESEMEEKMFKYPNKFSSGEKRKLLFLLVSLIKPDVLLLDEPEANLDPYARYQLYQKLSKLKKEGMAIILASHVIDANSEIIDYITILNNKEIVFSKEIASPQESERIYNNFNKGKYDKRVD